MLWYFVFPSPLSIWLSPYLSFSVSRVKLFIFSNNSEKVIIDASSAPVYTVTYMETDKYVLGCEYTDADGMADRDEITVDVCTCKSKVSRSS